MFLGKNQLKNKSLMLNAEKFNPVMHANKLVNI